MVNKIHVWNHQPDEYGMATQRKQKKKHTQWWDDEKRTEFATWVTWVTFTDEDFSHANMRMWARTKVRLSSPIDSIVVLHRFRKRMSPQIMEIWVSKGCMEPANEWRFLATKTADPSYRWYHWLKPSIIPSPLYETSPGNHLYTLLRLAKMLAYASNIALETHYVNICIYVNHL